MLTQKDRKLLDTYESNWNLFAHEVLGVNLDEDQRAILGAIQTDKRVTVRSGTSRGKDYVAAVAAICFLYLNYPSKVICTAPTGRQVRDIMMSEIATIYRNTKIKLGGELLIDRIKFDKTDNWFLHAFKADDSSQEVWSGYHSPNIMVLVTEASGIPDIMFDAIEGILQNNSRFAIFFNPNRLSGEAYKSIQSSRYTKFKLNDLNAPNVLNWVKYKKGEITKKEYQKRLISGQVDGAWVDDKVKLWCHPISKQEFNIAKHDFVWFGNYYRPDNLFRIKVLGEFPKEDDNTLIPMDWIEAANERYIKFIESGEKITGKKIIGSDIAGEGRDSTVHTKRYLKQDIVTKQLCFGEQGHMQAAGYIKNLKSRIDEVFIDTIGEGAGVYARLAEQKISNVFSAKNSYSAKGLKDITAQLTFQNMRSYIFWAIRDWLNPAFGSTAKLPPDDTLAQELNCIKYEYRSNGKIQITSKEDMKAVLKRSPDRADSLSLTFFPKRFKKGKNKITGKNELGIF